MAAARTQAAAKALKNGGGVMAKIGKRNMSLRAVAAVVGILVLCN